MPSVYVPSPSTLASITIPSDGDPKSAASVNVAFEALADAVAGISKTIRIVKGSELKAVTSAAISPVASAPTWNPYTATDVQFTRNGFKALLVDAGSAIAWGYMIPLTAHVQGLHGYTLSSVRCQIAPTVGHGALPLVMPRYGVFRAPYTFVAPQDLISTGGGFVVDSSANVATYEAAHDVTYTPNQNNVIDIQNYGYNIILYGEGHTNAIAGSAYASFELTFTA